MTIENCSMGKVQQELWKLEKAILEVTEAMYDVEIRLNNEESPDNFEKNVNGVLIELTKASTDQKKLEAEAQTIGSIYKFLYYIHVCIRNEIYLL